MLPYKLFILFFDAGTEWLSGRMLDSRSRGCGFEPHRRHCVVSLSKMRYPLLITGPEIIKLVPCSTQLSTKFILLMNVKNANNFWHFITSTFVGILVFMIS